MHFCSEDLRTLIDIFVHLIHLYHLFFYMKKPLKYIKYVIIQEHFLEKT